MLRKSVIGSVMKWSERIFTINQILVNSSVNS